MLLILIVGGVIEILSGERSGRLGSGCEYYPGVDRRKAETIYHAGHYVNEYIPPKTLRAGDRAGVDGSVYFMMRILTHSRVYRSTSGIDTAPGSLVPVASLLAETRSISVASPPSSAPLFCPLNSIFSLYEQFASVRKP